jgi:hypothetical protein
MSDFDFADDQDSYDCDWSNLSHYTALESIIVNTAVNFQSEFQAIFRTLSLFIFLIKF